MNQNLLTSLSQPVNNVAQAYETRTNALTAERAAQQKAEQDAQTQRDNDMLKVFEFAGDGRTNEARIYAQNKNLQIPEEIYADSDFSKGLTLAGKLYGQDPGAAQKFSQNWASTRGQGDFMSRLQLAQQAAGVPIDPNDREYQRKIAFELWKQKNIPEKPGIDRFKAGQDAYNKVMDTGLNTPQQADAARADAYKYWDQEYGAQGRASPGLVGGGDVSLPGFGTAPPVSTGPLSVRNNNPGNMRPVGASTGFQQFSSPEEGMQAMRNDLALKISGQSQAMQARFGPNYQPTLANVIATWAPPEENNTPQYVMFVSRQTGISPHQPLSIADIDRIVPAMIQMEGGSQAGQYFGASPAGQPQQQPVPSGLPQGSVMIGTANGRPVWQAPTGERFIDDGNP